MTIKEIYEYAKQHGAENYEAVVQYRDDGGYYYGEDKEVYCYINEAERKVVL